VLYGAVRVSMWAGGAWRIAAWTPAARVLPRARGERGDVRARPRRVRAHALDIGARRRWWCAPGPPPRACW